MRVVILFFKKLLLNYYFFKFFYYYFLLLQIKFAMSKLKDKFFLQRIQDNTTISKTKFYSSKHQFLEYRKMKYIYNIICTQ